MRTTPTRRWYLAWLAEYKALGGHDGPATLHAVWTNYALPAYQYGASARVAAWAAVTASRIYGDMASYKELAGY
ncbi:hypothetical protein CCAX7_25840 [Capsulimonas corticalis]|uniref:Uncharacterized protein n=1 Tax=Capsulimonas corticalis TaxID=2219043 RepID=A0A402CVR5_9BACT|nr:hypothetical protein CCAX7_25840 [Capsulimonas corticalis]